MKRFMLKIISLLIICSMLICGIYIILTMKRGNVSGVAANVFYSIDKTKIHNDCTIVYMGDSVCNQLWSQKMDEGNICHIGCNQAITPAGSYLLLNEYLKNNPQTKEVYYLVRPQTLANDMWLDFTYQYFIIPFCNNENIALLEQETVNQLYDKFGKIFVSNSFIKTILLNNNLLMQKFLDHIQKQEEIKDTHRISRTAIIYLVKMRDLCEEKGVHFYIKANPLADVVDNYGWDEFEEDIINYGLEDILSEFIESIPYYPPEWFSDGSHFKDDILKKYGDDIRKSVLE